MTEGPLPERSEARHNLDIESELPASIDWEWRADALCAKNISPTLDWFPKKHKKANAEKNVCAVCPVRQECVTYSVVTWQPWGVWGGYNDRERRIIKKIWRAKGLLLSRQGEHQIRFDDVEVEDGVGDVDSS